MTHIAVLTRLHRDVFRLQLVEMIVINQVFCLIAIAYHGIVFTLSQVVYRLFQVVDTHTDTPLTSHQLANGA